MARRLIDYSSKPPLPELTIRHGHLSNYERVYSSAADGGEAPDLARYLQTYEDIGASKVVVKARDLETTFGTVISNDDVAAFCRDSGDRFIGFAGVDPHKGMAAIRELERAVRELGLRGLNIQCFEHKLAINDKLLYPLYAKCIELDIPVNIHCGINFSTQSNMAYGQPMLLDEVMVHFPDLRVCASPPGWPWITELLGVAWKHRNVHIGIVYMRPRVLGIPDSGYGPLLQYGRTLLKDRIIFGSGYPSLSIERAIAEIEQLDLGEDLTNAWLHDNCARFLRLDSAP
jgi:predicted TIM-barrel fold metal-dependent hydrolase